MPNLTAFLHLFSTDVLKLTFALLWENRTVGVARDVFLVVSYYKHVYDNKYALECSSWINYIYFLLILTCEYFPLIFSFFRKSVKGWEGEKEKEVEGEGERKRFLWNTMIRPGSGIELSLDWELNMWPSGVWANALTTVPCHPGLNYNI